MITLRAELAQGLDDPVALRDALQTAIRLEHATIPTYLYALYSLTPGTNGEIATLLRSVVVEEMTHMGLACNMLNAIGGAPVIDGPGFLPDLPGPAAGLRRERPHRPARAVLHGSRARRLHGRSRSRRTRSSSRSTSSWRRRSR